MNDTNKPLFQDFKPATKQEWIEKVNIDLKGSDFNKTLVWKNLSKVDFQPFYTKEDNQVLLNNTGKNSEALINFRNIIVTTIESANALALKAVEEGMTGLLFSISSPVSAAQLLNGINLNEVTVSFNLNSHTVDFANDFISFVDASKVTNLNGYINSNLIANYVSTGNLDENHFNIVADLIKATAKYPNFKALTVSGNEYLNSGANQVQEVAYTLNSLIFIIEKLIEKGISVQSIFDNLNFDFAIGSEYFIEIGKFRAFNTLLSEVALKYGISKFSHTIIAKTSVWNKSITDAHTNLLRATTEAMSAATSGVHSIAILPYDMYSSNGTSVLAQRMAINISTILQEESYLAKVVDPLGGSYTIELLTDQIAKRSWELFQKMDDNGGLFNESNQKELVDAIIQKRQQRIDAFVSGKTVGIGMNKFKNPQETNVSWKLPSAYLGLSALILENELTTQSVWKE